MSPSRSLLVLACLWGCSFFALADNGGLHQGDLVAICGDSITEQKLYSRYIALYLILCQPQENVQSMQFGWSGETAYNFQARQKNDCLVFQPTVATICYGMNDAGYTAPADKDRLNGYRKCLAGIIKKFKESGVRMIVLGSPGVVDSEHFKKIDPADYNNTLGEFAEAAKELAEAEGVTFADVHGLMLDAMTAAKLKYGKQYPLAGADGVHPGPNGHLVMAYAFLKALGCSGDVGTITVDLKAATATATGGHQVLSASHGVVELESTRYPFCFSGDPKEPTTRSAIDFVPFNEDLNRYMLVVRNPPSANLKVTWGATSRVFSAADLEKGINLAEKFPDNPFSEPFAKMSAAVLEQQIFETSASKIMLNSLLSWRKYLPDQEGLYENLQQALVEKAKLVRAKSQAAVTPIKHRITIEPAA